MAKNFDQRFPDEEAVMKKRHQLMLTSKQGEIFVYMVSNENAERQAVVAH